MSNELTPFEALQKAIEIAGGQSALARICGKSQPTVWKWLQSSKRVPAEDALTVEAATGVSRHDLRPDIYPRSHVATPDDVDPPLDCSPVMSRSAANRQSNRKATLDKRTAA